MQTGQSAVSVSCWSQFFIAGSTGICSYHGSTCTCRIQKIGTCMTSLALVTFCRDRVATAAKLPYNWGVSFGHVGSLPYSARIPRSRRMYLLSGRTNATINKRRGRVRKCAFEAREPLDCAFSSDKVTCRRGEKSGWYCAAAKGWHATLSTDGISRCRP